MRHVRQRTGFTIVELLVVVLAITLLLAAILPSIARAQNSSGVQQSMSNLVTMGVTHVLYALDWDGRQVTWVKDDLGIYDGDVVQYNVAVGGCSGDLPWPADCQPPIIAGQSCDGLVLGYWPNQANRGMLQPIGFAGGPGPEYWGHFRVPNARSFHQYLNGRYHDPMLYAPKDTVIGEGVAECIDEPCEFVWDASTDEFTDCNPGWSSYAFSAAAMFHPDVFRSNAAGGWQAPWQLDHSYEAPGLFQATFPDLKTHMIEHSWLQNPIAECNPSFTGCEPYYFNHGFASTPVTLFYDGAVRLLPNTEVHAADQQVLQQTGGVDGLWHRGTTFGNNGYLISDGYDAQLSHHVLTTDGILGRDTLDDTSPPPMSGRRTMQASLRAAAPAKRIIDWEAFMFTPDTGDEP